MEKDKLVMFYEWFENYFDSFKNDDEKINANLTAKKLHTLRVCGNICKISKALNLTESEINLAEAIGLFHDVGRFEQFSEYKTFKDGISVDHADLGVKILKKFDVLKDISISEKDILLKAVEYHNKYALPENLADDCLLFCKLIRDADKLDILGMLVDYYENPQLYENEAFEDYPDTGEYQKSFVENIISFKKVSYRDVKSKTDIKLLRISWIYDVNFDEAFRIIKDNRYMERIFKFLPKTGDIEKLERHINRYMDERVKKSLL